MRWQFAQTIARSVSRVCRSPFSTLGLIMAFYSGVLAFQALISGNTPEQIGHAANYGLAVGFAVGAVLSSLVFISTMTNIE
jgi:hypothetical protein